MKVLLDENLDHALRKLLGHHEVVTAVYMGWTGVQNGELLRAEDSEFDVLLTGDQTLKDEQNLTGRRLAIVVLSDIRSPVIEQHLPNITAIDNVAPGLLQTIDCGTFTREKPPLPRRAK